MTNTEADTARRGFTLTRMLDAPPVAVCRAWDRPDHLGWFSNPNNPRRPSRSRSISATAAPAAGGGRPELDPRPARRQPPRDRDAGGDARGDVRVELPASLSEDDVRDWLALGIRNGWQDTVDRLAATFAPTWASVRPAGRLTEKARSGGPFVRWS